MKMDFKEIEFKPYDPAHNDISCEDGELEGWGGGSAPGMEVRFTIDEGEILAMHQGRAVVYHEGCLKWVRPSDGDSISAADLVVMAEIPRPVSLAVMGDTVVTAGEGGLSYHRWKEGGYITLPQLPPLPRIEFGLRKEGEMTDTCSLTIPISMVPAQGDGMTDPHPSANNTGGEDTSASIDKIVDTLIRRAEDDKHGRGYFTAPFFVRYAARDHAGNTLCVSPPALMAGSVLPPCIGVTYTSQTEKEATMRCRLDSSAYFSLQVRALPLPEKWIPLIKSIDIYVSPQIPTWSAGAGYLCSYANVLGQVNGASGHRGRVDSGSSDDTMFAGHYSNDGINYIDHFTDATLRQTNVWYVSPNVGLAAALVCEHRFYRIASFSPTRLSDMTDFMPLSVDTTAAAHLESLEPLGDIPVPVVIYPDVLATLNGRLVAGGGFRGIEKPADPASASAFSGSTSAAASSPVIVSVFTRQTAGKLRRVSATYSSLTDFSSGFPRYIYHPDGDAEMITIESRGTRYRLPLSRHPFLPGAYWFGGLTADYNPAADTEPVPSASTCGRIPCHDRVWLSAPGSPCHFALSGSMVACNSRVRAISTSVVTPDITSIGKYPVYVFADDGLWLAEYDSDRRRLCGSYRISSETCVSEMAVVPTDEGVAFATGQSLMIISGTKIRRLLSFHSLSTAVLPELPGGPPAYTAPAPISSPVLAYDGATSSLIVADAVTGIAYIYDITARAAVLWSRHIVSIPVTTGRSLIRTDACEVGCLAPPTGGCEGILVTRPIKLTKTFVPKIIRSVTLWHSGYPNSVAVKLYGANSLSDWHLIASSPCHRAELPSRSRWRFLRIVVTPKEAGTEVYGAQINFEC